MMTMNGRWTDGRWTDGRTDFARCRDVPELRTECLIRRDQGTVCVWIYHRSLDPDKRNEGHDDGETNCISE